MSNEKRIETCAGCGETWNVSRVKNPVGMRSGWYVCPICQGKSERVASFEIPSSAPSGHLPPRGKVIKTGKGRRT